MSIYPCNPPNNVAWPCRAALILIMLICASSVHARGATQIEDHYFAATLFLVQTGHAVVPPVGVHSLLEYESIYGRTSGSAVDHGYQAARLFFANGGQTLYVSDPHGATAQAFANALTASVGLPVDLVAIPGAACCSGSLTDHAAIMAALAQHVGAYANRFGLIDAPRDSDANALIGYRARFSSEHAALYAPWLVVDDPEQSNSVTVPSSSAVAGVISRIDREEGIYRLPAGTNAGLLVPPLTDVERAFSSTDLASLNAANVNILRRFLNPLSIKIWGGRTTSDEPSRRYVNVARFLRHLQFSMSRSLGAIFGSAASAPDPVDVKRLLEDYLHDYWQRGALQGTTPNQAYFVTCTVDPSVLSCTVGVAMLRPSEFDLFQFVAPYGDVIFASGFE